MSAMDDIMSTKAMSTGTCSPAAEASNNNKKRPRPRPNTNISSNGDSDSDSDLDRKPAAVEKGPTGTATATANTSTSNQDDENDDDKESDSDNNSSSSSDEDENNDDQEEDNDSDDDSDEGDNDDDQKDDAATPNPDGLSEYERLREERIRRNQQYLQKLGLDESIKPQKKKAVKRKRLVSAEVASLPRRSSLGRATKEKPITYNVDRAVPLQSLLGRSKTITSTTATGNDSTLAPAAAEGATATPTTTNFKNRKTKKPRVPLVVYKELKRIGRLRRVNRQRTAKHVRGATQQVKFWQRRYAKYMKKSGKVQEQLAVSQQDQDERLLLGTNQTKLEGWKELDKRKTELWQVVREYEQQMRDAQKERAARQAREVTQKRDAELDGKLELIDALDRFPKAYQEIRSKLDTALVERSPKDPPPPRRSQRASTGGDDNEELLEEDTKPKAAAKKRSKEEEEEDSVGKQYDASNSWALRSARAAAAAIRQRHEQEQLQDHTDNTSNAAEGTNATSSTTTTTPTPTEAVHHVGGWVSPPFSTLLDRSWLSRESPSNDSILSIPPQVGQIVLYYPGAHKQFLQQHPDIWAAKRQQQTGNERRTPLWVQAQQEMMKQTTTAVSTTSPPPTNRSKKVSDDSRSLEPETEREPILRTAAAGAPSIILPRSRSQTPLRRDPLNPSASLAGNNPKEKPIATTATKQSSSRTSIPRRRPSQTPSMREEPMDDDTEIPASNTETNQVGDSKRNRGRRGQRRFSSTAGREDERSNKEGEVVIDKGSQRRRQSRAAPVPESETATEQQSRRRGRSSSSATDPALNVETATPRVGRRSQRGGRSLATPMREDAGPNATSCGTRRERTRATPMTNRQGKEKKSSNASNVSGTQTSTTRRQRAPSLPESDDCSSHENSHSDPGDLTDTKNNTEGMNANVVERIVPWWTKEWIDGIDCDLGQYPVVCRVEECHTEFPYDPNLDYKRFDKDGNVTWLMPGNQGLGVKKDKRGGRPTMRLCLQLRPLTPILAPEWDDERQLPRKDDDVFLPPKFAVVSFPSTEAAPFLVPFAWAYTKTHSLSIGESVDSSGNGRVNWSNTNGKVCEFRSIGGSYGSFGLHDKSPALRDLLQTLSSGGTKAMEEAMTIPWSSTPPSSTTSARTSPVTMPSEDTALLVDFWNLFLQENLSTSSLVEHQETVSTSSSVENGDDGCSLLDLIRSTLPLYHGVGIRREACHRKLEYTSGWKLRFTKKIRDGFGNHVSLFARRRLRQGVPNCLENSLRVKLRFALQIFLVNRPESSSFVDLVTEDVAPNYYCAVPIGMHFGRILARLDTGKKDDHCYYTSVESLLADVQTIVDNCILYNSPDSPLVTVCSNLIPALKKQVSAVLLKHEKEHTAACILPASADVEGGSHQQQGIGDDTTRAISRCFDILKSRCLNGLAPDYIDPKLRLQDAQNGTLPSTVSNTSTRALPSFEDLLSEDQKRAEVNAVSTRGIRRTEDDRAIRQLSKALYLPPWSIDTIEDDKRKFKFSNYDTTTPFPNASLEFVRIRLKNGHYHQSVSIINDLQEAYVASTIFLLLGPASRKKKRISIEKIAKHLRSSKDNTSEEYENRDPQQGFTVEEESIVSRLEVARKLYTMAILAVSETRHVEKLFGLTSKQASRASAQTSVPGSSEWMVDNPAVEAAGRQIRFLLAATGHEPCLNRFKDLGSTKLKISVDGQTIRRKHTLTNSIVSHIALRFNDFSADDALAGAMLRRPGRRAPCARCQVYNHSFYQCRALRCHSNPDFDFVANWKAFGGIDGLLAPFKAAQISSPAGRANTGDLDASNTTGDRTAENEVDKILQDPSEELAKARDALKTSTFLSRQAEALLSHRARLGVNFIQSHFPIDPSDGHYLWCTVCGLSGDVLCCDGCANVVHTNCIGLSAIPNEDWFCEKCSVKRAAEMSAQEQATEHNPSHSQSDTGGVVKKTTEQQELNDVNTGQDATSRTVRDELSLPQCIDGDLGNTGQDTAGTVQEDEAEHSKSEIDLETPINQTSETGTAVIGKPASVAATPVPGCVITDEEFEEQTESLEGILDELSILRSEIITAKKAAKPVEVGTTFLKYFDDLGEFEGKVVSIPSESQSFYRVHYEDGDSEDLEPAELAELLQQTRRKRMKEQTDQLADLPGGKRKRGRPRKYPLDTGVIHEGAMGNSEESTTRRMKRARPAESDANGREERDIGMASMISRVGATTGKRRGRPKKNPMEMLRVKVTFSNVRDNENRVNIPETADAPPPKRKERTCSVCKVKGCPGRSNRSNCMNKSGSKKRSRLLAKENLKKPRSTKRRTRTCAVCGVEKCRGRGNRSHCENR